MRGLYHGWSEGKGAAAFAGDATSRFQLRYDYLFSRLLKLGCGWGYNQPRRVNLRGGPVHYRFNRGDLQSLREVLIEEVYACDLPFQPKTMLDLGANIGLASVWFSRRIRGDSTSANQGFLVMAVEPMPENAVLAGRNFQDNQIPGEVIQAAVAQRSGQARFEVRAESNLGQLMQEGESTASQHIRVPVIGIRELLDRFPAGCVDLVKMDIEGGEQDLLGHETDWLGRVKALMVEWHDDRADSRPLIRNVEACGFRHQRINAGRQDNLSLFVRKQSTSSFSTAVP